MNLFAKKPLLPLEVSNGSKPAVGNFQIPQSNSASASLAKPGSANDSTTVGGGSSALAARKARMGVAAAEKLTIAIRKIVTTRAMDVANFFTADKKMNLKLSILMA